MSSIKFNTDEEKIFEKIKSEVQFIKLNYKKNLQKDLWETRVIKNLENINAERLKNFRKVVKPISEFPDFEVNFFSKFVPYKYASIKFLESIYNKLKNEEKDLLSTTLKFNHIGNPYFIKINDQIFNERWLSNLKCAFFIKKNILEKFDKNDLICDIGGGYGNFIYMLIKLGFKGKSIVVDLPEQLIYAKYYLGLSFPGLKINNLNDFYNLNHISDNDLEKFDILLLTPNLFLKIKKKITLLCNFYSFGEMGYEHFNSYINSQQYIQSKYIYLINHSFSNLVYNTNINILDYKLLNFKKIYLGANIFREYAIHQYYLKTFKKVKNKGLFFEFFGENKKTY